MHHYLPVFRMACLLISLMSFSFTYGVLTSLRPSLVARGRDKAEPIR
jgi:hypothetical protein